MNLLTISDNIKLPIKEGDVGYNLHSSEDAVIKKGEVCYIHTGIKVKIPEGLWAMLTARSSAVFKFGIHVLSGIIDNGFTGELIVPATAVDKQIIIPKGTAIAQLIFFNSICPNIELVEMLPTTERGETGFGSTNNLCHKCARVIPMSAAGFCINCLHNEENT